MTLNEYIDFLEPQPAHGGNPARAGAICESAADWTKKKTALEQACRELGRRCSFEIQEMIRAVKSPHHKGAL